MRFFSVCLLLVLGAFVSVIESRDCPPVSVLPHLSGNVSINGDGAYYAFRASASAKASFYTVGGVAVYSSVSVAAGQGQGSGSAGVDLVSGRLTAEYSVIPLTSIPPTASLAWFSSAANYNFNISNLNISGNANAGVFTSAINTIFLSVFEYEDNNGNGVYDPNSSDNIVSTKSLNQLPWDTFCSYNNDPLVISNLTSIAGPKGFVFGIQTTLSDVVGVTSEGQVITPRSMKIDLLIKNYPYIGNNTRLAMQTIVATAQANASASASLNVDVISCGSSSSELSFSWNSAAQVDDNPFASVSASGFGEFTEKADLGLATLIFFAGASASASVDYKQIFFSFDGIQPSYVYWDPTISSGPLPDTSDNDNSNHALAIGLGVGLGLAGIITIGAIAFVCIRHKKMKNTEETLVHNDQLSGASYTQQA